MDKNDIGNSPFFPVTSGTRDASSKEVFTNDVRGGMTIREHVALELTAALFSNPALVTKSMTTKLLINMAFSQADYFIEKLAEGYATPQDGEPN